MAICLFIFTISLSYRLFLSFLPAPAPDCKVTYTDNGGKERYRKVNGWGCAAGETCKVENDDGTPNEFDGLCVPETCGGLEDPDDTDDQGTQRVTICHRTCSETNPWVRITIDDDAWDDALKGCGGHKREHNVTDECAKYGPDWTAWGMHRGDYLIKKHGTRATVRADNGFPEDCKGSACIDEKAYWFKWERACPAVRNDPKPNACCSWDQTDETELDFNMCCGDPPAPYALPLPDASVEIQKTVKSKGDVCSVGDLGGEHLMGDEGDSITYCYKITNTGATTLCSVTVSDLDAGPGTNEGMGNMNLGCLVPGQVEYVTYETTLSDVSEETYGTVVGISVNEDYIPYSPDPVTDTDSAHVSEKEPLIEIIKTVHSGIHDTCTDGSERVYGSVGDDVTYCYKVTNIGDTKLCGVTVTDELVGGTYFMGIDGSGAPPDCLEPGETKFAPPSKTTIPGPDGEDIFASVVGNPVDDDGNDIPDLADVSDSDNASVKPVTTGIQISKTVRLGHIHPCASGEELVYGIVAHEVTYCYEVTNTGTVKLCQVMVTDRLAGGEYYKGVDGSGAPDCLEPGETKFAPPSKTTIPAGPDGEDIFASVVGNPVDNFGIDISNLADVSDSDNAAVKPIAPSISLEKTVFIGDVTCSTGMELVTGAVDAEVTYCYEVTNNGDTYLKGVTLKDPNNMPDALPINIHSEDLAPDASYFVKFVTSIPDGGIVSNGTVVGTPVNNTGSPYPDLSDVSDQDGAGVSHYEGVPITATCATAMGTSGSEPCDSSHNVVTVAGHVGVGASDSDADILFDIQYVNGDTISFQVDNPFGVAMDMYVQYHTPTGVAGAMTEACVQELGVPGCKPDGDPIIAACIDPNVEGQQPFSVVQVYFVNQQNIWGAGNGPLATVDECCHEGIEEITKPTVQYSFIIHCACEGMLTSSRNLRGVN
jgi:uncharacterized repeat protein (TIGR01451 family)